VLVLGAGGAARGIIPSLLAAPIASLTIYNRTIERAQQLQQDFPTILCVSGLGNQDHYDLIINATSMKQVNLTKWHWDKASPLTLLYDLAYSTNELTPFVQWGKACGCRAVDGLGMLVEQAAESFSIWHGVFPRTDSLDFRSFSEDSPD
jgi:shikimate dehydrogenase